MAETITEPTPVEGGATTTEPISSGETTPSSETTTTTPVEPVPETTTETTNPVENTTTEPTTEPTPPTENTTPVETTNPETTNPETTLPTETTPPEATPITTPQEVINVAVNFNITSPLVSTGLIKCTITMPANTYDINQKNYFKTLAIFEKFGFVNPYHYKRAYEGVTFTYDISCSNKDFTKFNENNITCFFDEGKNVTNPTTGEITIKERQVIFFSLESSNYFKNLFNSKGNYDVLKDVEQEVIFEIKPLDIILEGYEDAYSILNPFMTARDFNTENNLKLILPLTSAENIKFYGQRLLDSTPETLKFLMVDFNYTEVDILINDVQVYSGTVNSPEPDWQNLSDQLIFVPVEGGYVISAKQTTTDPVKFSVINKANKLHVIDKVLVDGTRTRDPDTYNKILPYYNAFFVKPGTGEDLTLGYPQKVIQV